MGCEASFIVYTNVVCKIKKVLKRIYHVHKNIFITHILYKEILPGALYCPFLECVSTALTAK